MRFFGMIIELTSWRKGTNLSRKEIIYEKR